MPLGCTEREGKMRWIWMCQTFPKGHKRQCEVNVTVLFVQLCKIHIYFLSLGKNTKQKYKEQWLWWKLLVHTSEGLPPLLPEMPVPPAWLSTSLFDPFNLTTNMQINHEPAIKQWKAWELRQGNWLAQVAKLGHGSLWHWNSRSYSFFKKGCIYIVENQCKNKRRDRHLPSTGPLPRWLQARTKRGGSQEPGVLSESLVTLAETQPPCSSFIAFSRQLDQKWGSWDMSQCPHEMLAL